TLRKEIAWPVAGASITMMSNWSEPLGSFCWGGKSTFPSITSPFTEGMNRGKKRTKRFWKTALRMLSSRGTISAYSRIASSGRTLTAQRLGASSDSSAPAAGTPKSCVTRSLPFTSQTRVRFPSRAETKAVAALTALFPVPPLPVMISSRLSSSRAIEGARRYGAIRWLSTRLRAQLPLLGLASRARAQARALTVRVRGISIAIHTLGGHAQEQSGNEAAGRKRRGARRQDRPAAFVE